MATSSKSLTRHDNDQDDNSNLRVTHARQAATITKGKEKGTISATADNHQDEYDDELIEEGFYDDRVDRMREKVDALSHDMQEQVGIISTLSTKFDALLTTLNLRAGPDPADRDRQPSIIPEQ